MTQTLNDLPVSLLPDELWDLVASAAPKGYCMLVNKGAPNPMGLPFTAVSSYKFLTELATDPQFAGDAWKQALISAGVGVGGLTGGYLALAAATGPLAPFTALGAAIAAPFFGSNRSATIIICNGTDGDMTLSGDAYQDCGVQTGKAAYTEVDPVTGSTLSTKPDTIPGVVNQIPNLRQRGIGIYRFEKNLDMGIGFYGTGGAISFDFTDPKIGQRVAISWLVPQTGDLGLGVTANLDHYSSLEDFYNKTAGARHINLTANEGGVDIKASVFPLLFPDDSDPHASVFTIVVKPS